MVNDDGNAPIGIYCERHPGLPLIFVQVEMHHVVINAQLFNGDRGFPPVGSRGGIVALSQRERKVVFAVERRSRSESVSLSAMGGTDHLRPIFSRRWESQTHGFNNLPIPFFTLLLRHTLVCKHDFSSEPEKLDRSIP